MAFFEWQDCYSVMITEIDEQHKQLIQLINRVHEEVERIKLGRAERGETFGLLVHEITAVISAIDDMAEYASFHFSVEEKIMLEYESPRHEEHKKAHENFVAYIQESKRDFDEGRGARLVEVADFLKEWLVEHILNADKKELLALGLTH